MLERFKGLATVIFCMLSAVIEMTQAWIPMRFSSLLDLILNVLGGALGMLYWKILPLKIIPGGR
jgi:glycopeptide antibiotics resistance protein